MKTIPTLLYILAMMSLNAQAGGNGAERNGGDTYAGEFKSIERSNLNKIKTWSSEGAIKITPEQIKALQDGYDHQTSDSVQVRLHACIQEQGAGDEKPCSKDTDERVVVNDHRANPPYFVIGRYRWDQLKSKPDGALDLEMIVLHEMLEAFLSQGNKIVDENFELSYQIKLNAIKDWEIFKSKLNQHLRDYVMLIRNYGEVDMSHMYTFYETLKMTPDFELCMDKNSGDLFSCIRLSNMMTKAMGDDQNPGFLRKNIDDQIERIKKKVDNKAAELIDFLKTINQDHSAWADFGATQLQALSEANLKAFEYLGQYAMSPEFLEKANALYDEACPHVKGEKSEDRVRCSMTAVIPVMSEMTKLMYQTVPDRVDNAYEGVQATLEASIVAQ